MSNGAQLVVESPVWLQHADDIFKFFVMFVVGGLLVGLPKYLNKLPKNEAIQARYLISSILIHGSLGIAAGIVLIFMPIDSLLVLSALSAVISNFGVDIIKKIAIIYAAERFGIKLNGNGNGNGNGYKNGSLVGPDSKSGEQASLKQKEVEPERKDIDNG